MVTEIIDPTQIKVGTEMQFDKTITDNISFQFIHKPNQFIKIIE